MVGLKPKNWINTDLSNLCNEYSRGVFSSEEKQALSEIFYGKE